MSIASLANSAYLTPSSATGTLATARQSAVASTLYTLDYSQWVTGGETITGLAYYVTPVTSPALVISNSQIVAIGAVAGEGASFLVSGGAGGTKYTITVVATLSTLQTKTDTIALQVVNVDGTTIPQYTSTVLPSVLHAGVGAPSPLLGSSGDYYLDVASALLYGPQSTGSWPTAGKPLLQVFGSGFDGNVIFGNSGGAAPSNTIGNNGDYYFDVSSAAYYGAKASGAWPGTSTALGGSGASPGGTNGQVQLKNGTAFSGVTLSGDVTFNSSTGALTVTKANGVAFATSATTDTTNASNITSGTLAAARLPNVPVANLNSGTSASITTFWRGDGTWATPTAVATPGGTSGQVQYNNASSMGGFTVSGDGTLNTSTGALTVTKTNGVAFATSATTDATNASNIGSGTLAAARLPNVPVANLNSGTSASITTFWRGDGTWATPTAVATPGGTSGQVQYNNASSMGGFTVSGDGTLNTSTGALTVTKTNGVAFAASATTDTTNASNIGSGTLAMARLPTTFTSGFNVTPYNAGTLSSGTFTPAATNGNYQYLTNNGAFTLAAPASDCSLDLLVTNGSTAGAITFSGFTVGASTGAALTTTNTNKFIISIRRINSIATYSIYALQ